LKIGDVIKRILDEEYKIDENEFTIFRVNRTSLFEFLIGVILSQNTSDRNAMKAFENLREKLGRITPHGIIEAGAERVSEWIKPAGMHRIRSQVILELARIFSNEGFEKNLIELIGKSDTDSSRKILLEFPGIGDKTADVTLLMFFGKPVFPVDTHIRRITKRLGYVEGGRYVEISRFWATNTSPQNYLTLHLLLITHGRRVCRAVKPQCINCPLLEYCQLGRRVVSHGSR